MTLENGKTIKHIIDQAAFDEAVSENVELLDLSPEQAIEEAKTQFKSQNVELSNIITDTYLHGGIDKHPFVIDFNLCKQLAKEQDLNKDKILNTMKLVLKDMENDKAKRLYVGNNGGYPMGVELLQKIAEKTESNAQESLEEFQITSLIFLIRILTGYPDLLNPKDVPVFLNILKKNSTENQRNYPHSLLIQHTLELISTTLLLHENNRELWSNSPLFSLLTPILADKHFPTLLRMLGLFRAMCLDDDIRVEVPNTHERVRKMTDAFLTSLTEMLGEIEQIVSEVDEEDTVAVKTKASHASHTTDFTISLLKTISCLIVRNEHCAAFAESAGIESLHSVLRGCLTRALEGSVAPAGKGAVSTADVELCIAAMGLTKTVVGNDDVKTGVFEKGLVEVVVHTVSVIDERKGKLPGVPLYETYLLLLATLTLRHTPIVLKLYELNILEVIVSLMRRNPTNMKITKYGSWALRNICSRHKPAVDSLLQCGGAEVLEAGLKAHPSIGYDVKSAMKELGDAVDVKLDEQWTGKGKLNFNPEF